MDTVGGVGEIREDRLVTHLPTRPGALTKAARGLDRSGIVGFDRAQSNGEQATQKREAAQGAEYRFVKVVVFYILMEGSLGC